MEHASDACRDAEKGIAGIGQGEDHRHSGLNSEVDGEEPGLNGRKAVTADRLEHDRAIDEGLDTIKRMDMQRVHRADEHGRMKCLGGFRS